jgi:hypothetical protein
MKLVEDGSLEELFIAELKESEVAVENVGDAKLISFSFSKGQRALETLTQVCQSFSLDEVDDSYFERDGDEFILKGVNYPESEQQEEMIINKLL